jgi:hypothetical protein
MNLKPTRALRPAGPESSSLEIVNAFIITLRQTETQVSPKKTKSSHKTTSECPKKCIHQRQIGSLENSTEFAAKISQEFLDAIKLCLANTALELMRPQYDNISIVFACACLIGFVEGIIKTASELPSETDILLSTIFKNCIFEMLAKSTNEFSLHFTGKNLSFAELNFAKNVFQSSLNFKNDNLKNCLKALLLLIIFHETIATFFSTLLIIITSNMFVDSFYNSCIKFRK